MADKLTIKQEKFAQGLFAGLSQREAYKQAYDCKNMKDNTIDRNAYELANDNKITTRIKELTDELKAKNMVTVEWVLKRLVELNDRCMQGIPVYDKEGNETGEWKFEPNAANKSLELIGKHLGMFTDKQQIDIGNKDDKPFIVTTDRAKEIIGKMSVDQKKALGIE